MARGRSACDGCGRTLGAAELVPLVSWAMTGGRCRACGGRIAAEHPLIEGGAAVIGGVALAVAPGWDGAAGALFGWLLLTLAVLDARHHWLPDWLTLPLVGLGLAAGVVGIGVSPEARLVGAAAGFVVLWAIAGGYRAVRGRIGIGGGDPKLLGAIGAWLGWRPLPLVVLGAALIGLAWVAVRRVRGGTVRGDDVLPLGTLLAAAAWAGWVALQL